MELWDLRGSIDRYTKVFIVRVLVRWLFVSWFIDLLKWKWTDWTHIHSLTRYRTTNPEDHFCLKFLPNENIQQSLCFMRFRLAPICASDQCSGMNQRTDGQTLDNYGVLSGFLVSVSVRKSTFWYWKFINLSGGCFSCFQRYGKEIGWKAFRKTYVYVSRKWKVIKVTEIWVNQITEKQFFLFTLKLEFTCFLH